MTNTALTHNEYIDKNLELIQNQNKLSNTDLQNFAIQCKRTGLDPITRQIYAIPSGGKLNIMASIDGLRLIADRSGAYEGQTAPQWCGDDGIWKDVWLSKEPPKACKIGVYKTKFREPLVAIALFDEYAGKQSGKLTFMWAKMPALMIAKVAEALALRKSFPNEMSGIFSTEEMEQSTVSESQSHQNVAAIKDVLKESNFNQEIEKVTRDSNSSSEYIIGFGKNKGKKLSDVPDSELKLYLSWLRDKAEENQKPLSGAAKELYDKGTEYLNNLFTKRKEEPIFDSDEKLPF